MQTPSQGTTPQPDPGATPAAPQWTPPVEAPAAPQAPAPLAPSPAPPSPASRPATRWLNVALMGALVVAVAGVSFAAGRATAPSALDELRANAPGGGQGFPGQGGQGVPGQGGQGFPGQGGQGPQGGRFFGAGGGIAIEGTVESVDADSVTVKTEDGNSIEISLDNDTAYHTATDTTASAVTSGSKVVVRVGAGGGQSGGQGGGFSLDAEDVTVVP